MAVTTQQLFRAIHVDDQATVKRALSLNPALVHAKHPRDAHTPLHSAAAAGNLPLLKELLHLGASCQSSDFNNETPLHIAARQGHPAIVKELLRDAGRRSCLRSMNRDGATPLHLAAAAGHTDVVRMLLNAGSRGDLKDRAGRTPLDLVDADHRELAEILVLGRQLTPGSGSRSRRMISPGVSPTPFQNMAVNSPKLAIKSSQLQQPEPDIKAAADARTAARNVDLTADLPKSMNTIITGGVDGVPAVPYAGPHHVRVVQQDQGPPASAEVDQRTQEGDLSSQQSWLQYSPQRSAGGAFSRNAQQEFQPHAQPASYQRDVPAVGIGPRSDIMHSPSVPRSPMRGLQLGIPSSTAHTPGGSVSHYPQQRPAQQQQQLPHSGIGPLRSARAAGPMAGVAAAAAVNDLTKSFEYHPLAALGAPPSTVGPLKQQASTLFVAGGAGGASHIVSPEASSGLLAGPLPTAQHSSRDYHAAPSAAAQPTPLQPPGPESYENNSGPLSVRKSLNQLPSGFLSHQASQQATQPQHQQQQFAALATAVSASSRIGPLQLPVQSQLSELSNKVHQLEEWFDAQVELIPEWQKVLAVVQGVKRQVEEQLHTMLELENKSQGHSGSLEHLAMQVAKLQGTQANTGNDMSQMRSVQESTRATLSGMNEQIRQLESQLVHQASTAATRMGTTESLITSVSGELSAATDRLSTLENATKSIESQLHAAQQQVNLTRSQSVEAVEATRESTANSAAAASRIAALESNMAEMKQLLQELQQAKSSAAHEQPASAPASTQTEFEAQQEQRVPAQSAAHTPAAAPAEHSGLLEELNELKQRVSDLSVCVSGMDNSTPLQAGAVEETILPFMETTSNCLQQHEQQLDAIQNVVPKLESVVAQRAQMCELMQQVAALQTAFNLLTGGKDTLGGRSTPGMLPAGPLSAQKAAADYLAMATNMVKLQGQMNALSSAVEDLQQEWEDTAASMRTEHEAIRSAWESERSRMSAAEREAMRRLADQQKGLKAREEKLIEIREAAVAQEAAKRSQLESESRVTAALDSMVEQQQAMRTKITRLTEAGEAITAATEALKKQLDSLQAEMEQSLAELQPQIQQIGALNGTVDKIRQDVSQVKSLEAKLEDIQPRVENLNALEQKIEAFKPRVEHVSELKAKVGAIAPRIEHIQELEEKVEATKAEADALKERVEAAKAEAAAASRTSAFAAAKLTAARASAFAASVSSPNASARGSAMGSEPASPSASLDRQALDSFATPAASTHGVMGTPQTAAGGISSPFAAAQPDNPFLSTPRSSQPPSATAADRPSTDSPAQAANDVSSYLYWQQQMGGPDGAAATPPSAEPAAAGVGSSNRDAMPAMPDVSSKVDDAQQQLQPHAVAATTADSSLAPSKKFGWFGKSKKTKSKRSNMIDGSTPEASDQLGSIGQHDATAPLPWTESFVSTEPVAAAAAKPSRWAKKWQKMVKRVKV